MKIGIVGGGAIGLLFSAYYGEEYDVSLFCRREEQANKINFEGIQLEHGEDQYNVLVSGKNKWIDLQFQDFIIVTVKQYDMKEIIQVLHTLPRHIPLLFVQNGMGHLKYLESLKQTTILVGTIEHGAIRKDDCTVLHKGVGKTNIGLFRGSLDKNQFPNPENERFSFTFLDNYIEMLEKKLIANAVINPLTALFQVKNGELIKNEAYYHTFQLLYKDIIKCFPDWNEQDQLSEIEKICITTSGNTSSMLKDIIEGRRTEIDSILGYVLEKGKALDMDLPIAKFVYQSIIGMEIERGMKE